MKKNVVRLFASFGGPVKITEKGITDTNGVSGGWRGTDNQHQGKNEKKVILCQALRLLQSTWPTGRGKPALEISIEFDKPFEEIYIDYDDDIAVWDLITKMDIAEAYKKGLKRYSEVCNYKTFNKAIKNACLYGAYVKDIKLHELRALHSALFDPEANKDNYILDGKHDC